MMKRTTALSGLILALLLFSCGTRNAPSSLPKEQTGESRARLMATLLQDPYWQKRWWLEKTVRLFRGGKGLSPSEDIESLMRLSEEEILAKLTADPRFGSMVLDFNLYLMGFKPPEIRLDITYDSAYDFPAALSSAQAVLKGEDYFSVFDLQHPFYVGPQIIARNDSEKDVPDSELIRRRGEEFKAELLGIIHAIANTPEMTGAEACGKAQNALSSNLYSQLYDFRLSLALRRSPAFYMGIFQRCRAPEQVKPRELVAPLQKIISLHDRIHPQLISLAKGNYHPQTPAEVRAFEMPEEILGKNWISYGLALRSSLPNSSTNFNRKRAAYVLKRFFCDDLTPIGVENPKEHTDGKHGSQTSCYACHYKLDPMAGFFRNHGTFFQDFTGQPIIAFDDLSQTNLPAYLENWKAKPGRSRTWEVGYIRSINNEEMNDYGDTLGDLHSLLRRAPEVKRCIVKRMFQYFNSEDQTLDGGYLDHLTQEFETRSGKNSAAAFRWLAGQMALGRTYHHPDPVPTDCYDFKPGHQPGQAPPCRVAHVLQKNCASCHSSVYGAGELDLSSWITGPDGKKTFPHEKSGRQLTLRETLEKMVMRLSAADPRMRMPLSREMPSQERQDLYLWAQEQLSGANK